ncbi:MAG: methyltransferase [Oscillospiraceae bacterium]|jgi:16S rRNA (guanine1207-N2)-methyltransferase|nr:methyltransferase [Oscillospiraceae bacterium]
MSHYFAEDPALPDDLRTFAYYYGNQKFMLTSNSGVFSPGHVDPATDLLLKTVPPLQGSLLDLGCGYGVIGIVLAKAFGLEATLADVNRRALDCAALNCRQNDVAAQVVQSDGFAHIPGLFGCITLNPPIHAGKEVVYGLFAQAAQHLAPGGAFYVVMLEKHGAPSAARALSALFGNCEILYKKKGHRVMRCTKS